MGPMPPICPQLLERVASHAGEQSPGTTGPESKPAGPPSTPVAPQAPLTQGVPARQAMPQPPQLVLLLIVSTQLPPHSA